ILARSQTHRTSTAFRRTVNLVTRTNQQHSSFTDADESIVLDDRVLYGPNRNRFDGSFARARRDDEIVSRSEIIRFVQRKRARITVTAIDEEIWIREIGKA